MQSVWEGEWDGYAGSVPPSSRSGPTVASLRQHRLKRERKHLVQEGREEPESEAFSTLSRVGLVTLPLGAPDSSDGTSSFPSSPAADLKLFRPSWLDHNENVGPANKSGPHQRQASRVRTLTSNSAMQQVAPVATLSRGKVNSTIEQLRLAIAISEDMPDCDRAGLYDSHGAKLLGEKSAIMEEVRAGFLKRKHLQPIDVGDEDRIHCGFLSQGDWERHQQTLSRCLFELKCMDRACSEVAEQAASLCMEHGILMRELRSRYAWAFDRMHRLYSDTLWGMDAFAATVHESDCAVADARVEAANSIAEAEARHREELKEARADVRAAEEATQRAEANAKSQLERMSETVRTLNGIFRNMQVDGEQATLSDLQDSVRRLEQDVADREEEIRSLRALKDANASLRVELMVTKKAAESEAQEAQMVKDEIEKQNCLLAELMDAEARRLAEIETLHAKLTSAEEHVEEVSLERASDCKDRPTSYQEKRSILEQTKRREGILSDHHASTPATAKGHNNRRPAAETASADAVGEDEVPTSVLCIKCRKALDDISNIGQVLEDERKSGTRPRPPCHGFRLMLPNLSEKDQGLTRRHSVAWVRANMRAILRAKAWDDSVLHFQQGLRTRFPEFVFAYFEPTAAMLGSTSDMESRRALVTEADTNRWALYYGVKGLARESPEARMFWSLLDETHGADWMSFLLFVLTVVEGYAGESLTSQWGESGVIGNYWQLKDSFAAEEGHGEVVWLSASVARTAADHILQKALGDQRRSVMDALQAIEVSSEGRLPALGGSNSGVSNQSGTCMDLFLFLRVVLHSYHEEQVNRNAAVRLMFETAASGALTTSGPIYGLKGSDSVSLSSSSSVTAAEAMYDSLTRNDRPEVDLPQFLAIIRTLHPFITTAEAVGIYRDSHVEGGHGVDHLSFLKAAERWQFFSDALLLPVPSFTDGDEKLESLVRAHYLAMKPAITAVIESLPEAAGARLAQAETYLKLAMEDGSHRNGMPLACYRRLLAILFHLRNVRHESSTHESITQRAAFYADRELKALESHVFCDQMDARLQTYERIRLRLAAVRIQRTFRRKLKTACAIPLPMLRLIHPGIMRERLSGGIISRRNHRLIGWSQTLVEAIYAMKLRMGREMYSRGTNRNINLCRTTFLHLLERWGAPVLAERAAADLFFNLRNLAPDVARLRIFLALCGGRDIPGDDRLFNEEALYFYLRSVSEARRLHSKDTSSADAVDDPGNGDSIFPCTFVDPKTKRQYWHASVKVGKDFVRWAFDACSRSPADGKDLISNVELNYGKLMGNVESMARSDNGKVDMDDILLLSMHHWVGVRDHRRKMLRQKMELGDDAAAMAITSFELFKAFDESELGLRHSPSLLVDTYLTILQHSYSSGDAKIGVHEAFEKDELLAHFMAGVGGSKRGPWPLPPERNSGTGVGELTAQAWRDYHYPASVLLGNLENIAEEREDEELRSKVELLQARVKEVARTIEGEHKEQGLEFQVSFEIRSIFCDLLLLHVTKIGIGNPDASSSAFMRDLWHSGRRSTITRGITLQMENAG
jgi:hypothetical protein